MTNIIDAFMSDARTRLLMALILADVITGISAAVRTGTFDWIKIADFYRVNVIPYIVGYLGLWLFVIFGLSDIIPAELASVLNSLGAGAASASLGASIASNAMRAKEGMTKPDVTNMLHDDITDVSG